MNEYFCSIGNELTNAIPDKPNPLLNGDYSVNLNGATFPFNAISPQDFSRATDKIKSSKSFGVDMISIDFLKITLPYISLPWHAFLMHLPESASFLIKNIKNKKKIIILMYIPARRDHVNRP